MPALGVLNNKDGSYIRRTWGHIANPVSEKSVKNIRLQNQGRVTPWTETELMDGK